MMNHYRALLFMCQRSGTETDHRGTRVKPRDVSQPPAASAAGHFRALQVIFRRAVENIVQIFKMLSPRAPRQRRIE